MRTCRGLGDLRGGVFAALVDLDQVLLLRFGQFGLLAARPPGRFSDLHPLASARSDQVSLELSDHRQHIEEEPATRVNWVVNGTTDTELHFTMDEVIDNVFRIAKRTCQAVELGHDESVTGPACVQRFAKTWPGPGRPGEALVIGRYARATYKHPHQASGVYRLAPAVTATVP